MANKLHRLLKSGRIRVRPEPSRAPIIMRRGAARFPRRPSLPPPAPYLAPTQYERIPEAELQRGGVGKEETGG